MSFIRFRAQHQRGNEDHCSLPGSLLDVTGSVIVGLSALRVPDNFALVPLALGSGLKQTA